MRVGRRSRGEALLRCPGRDVSMQEERASRLLTGVTYLRIVLVPVVMALVLVGDRVDHAYAAAAVLFTIAAATDLVDGFLARRWGQTTTLGNFLDTTADKLLVSGVLLALVSVGRASPWVAFVIIGRELLILGLRGAVAAEGPAMAPSPWGKLKATAQFVAIFLALVRPSERLGPWYLDEYAMLVAAVLTVVSAAEYLVRFSGVLRGKPRS
jgi:CDP-diacylglycerol--glycerol-3-phosphate 3-phosphatidyltransferase